MGGGGWGMVPSKILSEGTELLKFPQFFQFLFDNISAAESLFAHLKKVLVATQVLILPGWACASSCRLRSTYYVIREFAEYCRPYTSL